MGINGTYQTERNQTTTRSLVNVVKEELTDLCERIKHQLISQSPLLNQRAMHVAGHNLAVDRAYSHAMETAIQLLEDEIRESERRLNSALGRED